MGASCHPPLPSWRRRKQEGETDSLLLPPSLASPSSPSPTLSPAEMNDKERRQTENFRYLKASVVRPAQVAVPVYVLSFVVIRQECLNKGWNGESKGYRLYMNTKSSSICKILIKVKKKKHAIPFLLLLWAIRLRYVKVKEHCQQFLAPKWHRILVQSLCH